MSRSRPELDLFAAAAAGGGGSSSVRGIPNAISRIDAKLVRSGGSSRGAFFCHPTPLMMPVLDGRLSAIGIGRNVTGTETSSLMTIFYKGTVAVFDLPADKAESVFKLAKEEGKKLDGGE